MIFAKYISFLLLLVSVQMAVSCTGNSSDAESREQDSIARLDSMPMNVRRQPTVEDLEYEVILVDSTVSGKLTSYHDQYADVQGSLTFRGGLRRDARYNGKITGTPSRVVVDWTFDTDTDNRSCSVGSFGGGTGWTGQPVLVNWPDSIARRFRKSKTARTTADFHGREIIFGSLCSQVYFLDYETGKPSRESLFVENPIKGSVMLDPSLNGSLYVGQGVPYAPPIGRLCVDLWNHSISYASGKTGESKGAYRSWFGNDSSPLAHGGFVFWPAEDGSIYKYRIAGEGRMTLHSILRYKVRGGHGAGVENSMAIYRNLGFFGDNQGDVLCINLDTLEPLWHFDNRDDIDASIVCEEEEGVPYLYCGCEVDVQGNEGTAWLVKLNGMDGSAVWQDSIPCKKLNIGGKHFDGGFYSTPLLGNGNCANLMFANICQRNGSDKAELVAIDRKTGKFVYTRQLDFFSWTSPVGFENEKGEMFIFTGDSHGDAYIFNGRTGDMLFHSNLAANFESSPVVSGNEMVVGSRGTKIYKFHLE